MKKLLLLVLLISNLSFAQDLSGKSIQQLQMLKTQAVSNENYELAGKINAEIKKREKESKPISEIEADLKTKLSLALKNEDYDQASVLKKKLKKIDDYKLIDQSITEAVKREDYQTASDLKKYKVELLKQINLEYQDNSTSGIAQTKTQGSTSPVINTTGGNGSLMFVLVGKKTPYYDVMVNDKLYGTITGDQVLIVENIPAGQHNICVVYDLKYKHNVSFTVKSNITQKIAVDYVSNGASIQFTDLYTISTISKYQIPDYSSKIDYTDGTPINLANIKSQSLNNSGSSTIPGGKSTSDGVYHYETQQLGIGGIFGGSIFPLKWQITSPIIKDFGLSYGYGGGFAVSSDFENFYSEFNGSFGYKYESDNFSPYTSYQLGFYTFNANIGVLSRLNIGCEFFLTPLGSNGIGLYTEWNYGLFVGGGNTISLGFVWRPGVPVV